MSLRRLGAIWIAALALAGIASGVALIALTTILQRVATNMEASLSSIQSAEELEVELLTYRASTDHWARVAAESRLFARLSDVADHVTTTEERELVSSLRQRLDRYVDAVEAAPPRTPLSEINERTQAEFEDAFETSRELIRLNVAQGQELRRSAAQWDRNANLAGGLFIVLFVGGIFGLAMWMRESALRPAVDLARVIDRHTAGDWSARANECGVAELMSIAHRFNVMASTLERQRGAQLAFLAAVAHDLRNPLSALKLTTAVVSPDRPLPPEDRMRVAFARVQRQVARLERMTNDLMDAAQIEAGTWTLELEEHDVRELVGTTVDLLQATAPAHQLVTRAPDTPVRVRCDHGRIEQVLSNLICNAIKYSPQGGTVQVSVEQTDTVRISVSDEGVGLAPDEIEHLFEPFHRAGRWAERVPGVGLGLFVVRRIVEAHGGRVWVDSKPGAGATFTVDLPTRPADGAAANETPPLRATGTAGRSA